MSHVDINRKGKQKCKQICSNNSTQKNIPVIAKSLISLSASGLFKILLICNPGNSFPMFVVESKDSYESNDPEYFKGVVDCGRAFS